MGRRKQFCPQKTGFIESSCNGTQEDEEADEAEEEDETGSLSSKDEKELESHSFLSTITTTDTTLTSTAATATAAAAAASMLALSPSSLFSVQLAQWQAAQLLSQSNALFFPSLSPKRKVSRSPDSPLDLSTSEDSGKKKRKKEESPLERLSEISKGRNSRNSAWSSSWLQRGEQSNKDVLSCSYCHASFSSFQSLTLHIKDYNHYGQCCTLSSNSTTSSPPPSIPLPHSSSSSSGNEKNNNNNRKSNQVRDILKEQLPIPRKLVRGQDVWLGKGEEQTRNILKCMWCGESFRSLDDMTRHMTETKHYTKVISQDQISNWKMGSSSSSSASYNQGVSPSEQICTAVLTCKVCSLSFSTLKDLSEHMVKNNHYKQSETKNLKGSSSTISSQLLFPSKEKRKKSLPVRKLLELERASLESPSGHSMRFPCDKCGVSFPFHQFAEHIRDCTPGSSSPKSILGSLEKMVSGQYVKREERNSSPLILIPKVEDSLGNGEEEEDDIAEKDERLSVSKSEILKEEGEGKKKNPLEALQLLCEKNEKNTSSIYGNESGVGIHPEPGNGFPFSWTSENGIKCPFCDSHFLSREAYKIHLAQMHFLVENPSLAQISNNESQSSDSQNKFEKYSQMAKQLSNHSKPLSSPA